MGSCYNSAVIEAPVDAVWDTISDFHDLAWAAGVIDNVEPGGPDGKTPGATRVLDEKFHETLISVDDEAKTFSYTIDDGPAPLLKESVSEYVGTVRLRPVTENDATFVEWETCFTADDEAAVAAFCNPIYVELLKTLKSRF